ncbi:hypothetical protein [Pseudobacillus badius]|uniref:hypothetical protein n=1 Tax=Bacillus badius TaxID=1455 RepID=UPI003D327C06
MKDIRAELMPKLTKINEMTQAVKEKLAGYLISSEEKPDISYELLQILNLSDDVAQTFNPDKTTGEFFGLPKEVVGGARFPKQIMDNRGVDFTPWFSEKTANIKSGAKKLIKYWETNVSDINLVEHAPMTVQEYLRDGIDSGLHQIEAYSNTIIEMLSKVE